MTAIIPDMDPTKPAKVDPTKIIEAIEHEAYPNVIGVQFHPEKPGLFDPDIVHPRSCEQSISFHEEIKGSDSYTFHKFYWKHLGKILQEARE